ncbi:uncharacterized protein K452DRAFT_123790 [Aplosporella prunicola CBS 121167]|uniref:Uncharacterized protein n=1 Tax=Aplosporella prunicola CBS 121167 TaxID=1176127 RepID=A0A6A6BNL8_9PEZI|nr:uncharacterized protein K452DRAFT_123790 [Aplosporella prunicola CBS 121167]KAF2145676.1 hypothetical protein K452DRAFT_123790 [Aplosporella prunicola CBS 121167]
MPLFLSRTHAPLALLGCEQTSKVAAVVRSWLAISGFLVEAESEAEDDGQKVKEAAKMPRGAAAWQAVSYTAPCPASAGRTPAASGLTRPFSLSFTETAPAAAAALGRASVRACIHGINHGAEAESKLQ